MKSKIDFRAQLCETFKKNIFNIVHIYRWNNTKKLFSKAQEKYSLKGGRWGRLACLPA